MVAPPSAPALGTEPTGGSHGQFAEWPNKSVRLIIPFTPGGSTDFQGRLLSDWLRRHFGQQFVIDHKPGAGSNIGIAELARSAPDGYTLGWITVASHAINPTLYAKMPFDHFRDFAPVSMTGTDVLHVPYNGGGPALTDVIGGQVHMTFGNMPTVLPHARGGKVRAVAVTSAERWFTSPEIPAIAETVPGFLAMSWHGVAFPAGTPTAIVDKLSAAIQRAMATTEMQEKYATGGSKATAMTLQEFAVFIREDTERWAPAIRASGARVE
jgi:tripartite-type tricarboxylate transporter receptor subunit TctC